jgi:hypothetical protein
MKKLLLAGICTLFVLGGCGRGISSKDVSKALADRPFSAKAVLVWHDRTHESQIIRTQQDGFCVIAASDALKIPVSFVQSQGGCVFTQGALALSMPVDEVPASGLASMMVQGLSRLSEAPQIRQNGPDRRRCERSLLGEFGDDLRRGAIPQIPYHIHHCQFQRT